MPGTVVAARVMLGISIVGDGLAVLVAIFGSLLVSSLQRSLVDPTDATGMAEGNHVVAGLVILGLFSAASFGITLWTFGPIRRGDATSRVTVTAVQVIETVAVGLALGVSGVGAGELAANLVLSLPFTAIMLGLLWVPLDSKRHFGDPGASTLPAASPAGARPSTSGWSDPPTVRFSLRPPPKRPLRPVIVMAVSAAGVIAVILVVLGLATSAASSTLATQAEGTWTCQALGDEDQDVYGTVDQSPFEVTIGDGTFSIPSRYLAGTWSLGTGGLSIDSTWSKVSSHPHSTVQISGLPSSDATQGSGSSPATYRTPTYPSPFGRTLDWSYSPGHLQVSGGTSIASTGVDCTKQSTDTTGI